MALFTISKAFSICGLSFLFINFQGRIKLSNIKIYRVVYRTFKFKNRSYFRVYNGFIEF